MFGLTPKFDEEFGEAIPGDQLHILRKHGKQAAHEKAGDGLAVVVFIFQALA